MRRHMTLIRRLLEHLECNDNGTINEPPEIKDYTPEQVRYHLQLCVDAGYVTTDIISHRLRLTWQGHETLEQSRL